MLGNQPTCGENLNLGLEIFVPISSVAGSPLVFFLQPLLTGKVFTSTAILIVAEILLLIAKHFFSVENIPIIVNNGQTVQMPVSELQEFLRLMGNGANVPSTFNNLNNLGNATMGTGAGTLATDQAGGSTSRGFPTPESLEAPVVVALYLAADYSNIPYTPYLVLVVPIFSLPGLRGALPLLILILISTIFVRAVVSPDTTGSTPLTKPKPQANPNRTINISPNDLLELLSRFGKHFRSQ